MSSVETRGERRSETARRNDDSLLNERDQEQGAAGGAGQQGRSGGNLQTDVGTQAEELRATDRDATESIAKNDHVAHGQGQSPPHPATEVVTERD